MKTNITKEDVVNLREEFLRYTATAEQHEFIRLLFIHKKLDKTIELFDSMPMEELNAMFRVVYKTIGRDFSEFV